MWLFPSGYGYVLQAGAVVNDMCGAFMTLTAVEFALRARRAMKISDLWTSGLAAMLMVSVKAFNLVLLLPWLIAVWPALKLSWRRPLATLAVVLLALGASMLPTALANIIYAGDWTAKSIDKVGGGDAKVLLLANALNQPIANLAPPVFPCRIQWEIFVQRHTPARLPYSYSDSIDMWRAGKDSAPMMSERKRSEPASPCSTQFSPPSS